MTFLSHDPVYYFFDDIWDFQILQKRFLEKSLQILFLALLQLKMTTMGINEFT